jgi:membrane protease subunit (stomatin/prohibitin family)
MQARTHSTAATFGRAASARRRIRRSSSNRLFCSTNGCTTLMQPDAGGQLAVCPICGAHRLLH